MNRFWARTTWSGVLRGGLAVSLIAALVPACQKKSPRTESESAVADKSGAKLDLAAAGDKAFSPDDGQSDVAKEKNPDYWAGVRFDVHNFEEVVDYVTTYYIEEKPDTQRAWVTAANNALAVLSPRRELLPTAFFQERRKHPDEEGRLDGTSAPFMCGTKVLKGVVMHKVPSIPYLKSKRKKRPDRRLTDDEIRELRNKDKERYRLYQKRWREIGFGRAQFRCVMTFVEAELKKMKIAEAQKAATAGIQSGQSDKAKNAAKSGKKPGPTAKSDVPAKPVAAVPKKDAAGQSKAKGESPKRASAAGKAKAAKKPSKPVPMYGGDDESDEDEDDEDGGLKRPKPDMNRAWLSAARAYLYALDPHSSVISRRAWDESTRKTENNSFEGIGAVLTQRDDRTIVENPMEQLPAWRAGVRAGDEIRAVDGKDVRGWLLNKVVDVIRGPKNTKVVLTVRREGEPKPLDIAITRAHIPIKNVAGKLLKTHKGVGYVKMTGFIPSSTRHVRDQLKRLEKENGKPLTGLILDLRRNSGGLLNRAIEVADMFLDHGVIVSVKSRRARVRGRPEEVHRARRDASDMKVPLIVLVNDGSASASEIVASAIQENGRGLVAGLRTFGKASVQTLFEPALHLDYYIKLTVARYYAPSGRTIQVLGVKPDIQIPPKVDGKIPLGYREENLTNHLDPIKTPHVSPLAPMLPALHKCVKRSGRAKKIVKADPHPQIQPDYQLLSAADYVLCLARLQNGQ